MSGWWANIGRAMLRFAMYSTCLLAKSMSLHFSTKAFAACSPFCFATWLRALSRCRLWWLQWRLPCLQSSSHAQKAQSLIFGSPAADEDARLLRALLVLLLEAVRTDPSPGGAEGIWNSSSLMMLQGRTSLHSSEIAKEQIDLSTNTYKHTT